MKNWYAIRFKLCDGEWTDWYEEFLDVNSEEDAKQRIFDNLIARLETLPVNVNIDVEAKHINHIRIVEHNEYNAFITDEEYKMLENCDTDITNLKDICETENRCFWKEGGTEWE